MSTTIAPGTLALGPRGDWLALGRSSRDSHLPMTPHDFFKRWQAADLSDDDLLARLLALNRALAVR